MIGRWGAKVKTIDRDFIICRIQEEHFSTFTLIIRRF